MELFGFRISDMYSRISPKEVAHVAMLARLSLTEQEAELYASQLSSVLDHASDIESLDIHDLEVTAHPLGLVNRTRSDSVVSGLSQAEALSQAPDEQQGMFSVPPVLGEPS